MQKKPILFFVTLVLGALLIVCWFVPDAGAQATRLIRFYQEKARQNNAVLKQNQNVLEVIQLQNELIRI